MSKTLQIDSHQLQRYLRIFQPVMPMRVSMRYLTPVA
jgi:hypothetical protein